MAKCSRCGKELKEGEGVVFSDKAYCKECYDVAKDIKELITRIMELKLVVGRIKVREYRNLLIHELEDAIRELNDVLDTLNKIKVASIK